ncbi:MAG TPA: RHS repeat-associated core domain-containing protein, partial [Acidimicrobiales bacterium]|nr:RHS repeat-associated core domain-containing protein [Acidimicrobiales bacterium]
MSLESILAEPYDHLHVSFAQQPWSWPLGTWLTTTFESECSINRYYDPTTDQFISIDPMVAQTSQPYVFTNDNPLNAEDPMGLQGDPCYGGTFKVTRNGPSCTPQIQKVSKSQTLKDIVNALKSSKAINALDLSGATITGIAKQLSSDMYKNGGQTISRSMANGLDALAGLGKGVSGSAGALGVFTTISSDLSNGNTLLYSAVDAGLQVGAGMTAGGAAAAACSELGPGALVCGAIGFGFGYVASAGVAAGYKYAFNGR